MIVLGLGAHLALSLFGPGYARAATVTLWLLVLGYLPTVPKMHFIAVCRAAGRISRAAVVLSIAATMEVTAAAVGGKLDGLKGLSIALLIVFFAEGLVTTPPVVRAAMGRGRHRHADPLAAATDTRSVTERVAPLLYTETMSPWEMASPPNRAQQEAGMAALLLLANGLPDSETPGLAP